MLFDSEKSLPSEIGVFDVCVVGTGAAGLVLASELSSEKHRVLLLEGGGSRYEARSQQLYDAEIFNTPFRGAKEGRVRMLGGTTTQWGGQIVEIDDFVFRVRPWITGSGWPFEKNKLLPYYLRAEKLERIERAYKNVEKIWCELGLEELVFNDHLNCEYSRFCPTTNFATIHTHMIHERENVWVFTHANACELIRDNESQTARGVLCRTLTGKTFEFSAKTYVLCMGGIENARFLLQPTQDGRPQPWNRFDLIGRYFQDHISCFVADIENLKLLSPDKYFDYAAIKKLKYHLKMKIPFMQQMKFKTLDMCGTIGRKTDPDSGLVQAYETARFLKARQLEKVDLGHLVNLLAYVPELLWHKLPFHRSAPNLHLKNEKMSLCVHCEQDPLSDSRISLSSDRDVLGLFKTKVDWRVSELELHSIYTFVEIFKEAFYRNGLGEVSAYPEVLRRDTTAISELRETYHHIGGTRMSETKSQGVVDKNLKLYGTSNVFVCGSSVFPCAGFANPTHTIIALAIRLADHLKSFIRSSY